MIESQSEFLMEVTDKTKADFKVSLGLWNYTTHRCTQVEIDISGRHFD